MKTKTPALFRALLLMMALLVPHLAKAQVSLTNPNWNIWLTDFGYSDLLLDNTPGFEGREYLSGEWGAAVSYQINGGATVPPQWLEPNFIFPNWATNSNFHVVSPLAITGANADGLPIAQSKIANGDLEITLDFEMLDTITGTPMGMAPASAAGAGSFMHSNRYVLKQTYTVKNIAAAALSNVQLFQMLHGLNSQRGVYDNRLYTGPLSQFHYNTTLAGVDAFAAGAGSPLEDFIGFRALSAPGAHEIGHYGIEGNGVDDHSIGKPSDGVHLSIEDNWQTAPYSTRQGTDSFAPSHRWVAGAQRWALGNLAPNQTTSFDVVLSILTGTKVPTGNGSSGSCDGGSNATGGLDYQFDDVTTEGSCFSNFSRADENEISVRIAADEFGPLSFLTAGQPAQIWKVEFSGQYSGSIQLTFGYDATLLPGGFDQNTLAIFHFSGGIWTALPGVVDPIAHTIAVTTTDVGAFALGVEGGVTFTVDASVSPVDSGSVAGAGSYAQSASVTLVATPNAGYVFANWTEGGGVVSASPSYTFHAQADRTLVANFVPVGAAKTISTSSQPSSGGSTTGDGAYALGASATVIATANPGYKFSKWQVNGSNVSSSKTYTFTVTGDRALVAKFKPVYTVTVTPMPAAGGDAEADSASYELGEKAVMKAFPASGYSFVNWTQNGIPVSTDDKFIFNVTENRDLVANFALGHRMDLSADPKSAGSVLGGGVYETGTPVTLTAVPKPGYIFLDWTENGDTVSTDAEYTFPSATDRVLVARLIALPTVKFDAAAPGTLTVTWPAGATGWTLQESADLSPGSWIDSTRPVTVVDGMNHITVPTSEGIRFFRLWTSQ